ncbi:MAG: CapA family protein [Bacteroidales bacterium]|nr:CapA family protein [Bacteroidales bacterium]
MLKIVGDISLTDGYFDVGFGVGSKIGQGFDPFQHILRAAEDCWIGNFEGVASETSERTGTAALQFRVTPECLSGLKHFDLYGLANNHAMQHGSEAYQRTLEFLTSQGVRCFGSNVQKSQIFEHQGRVVSITAFSQRIDAFSDNPCYWHNPEYREIEEEYATLPQEAYKILFVHWGNEFINRPSSQQKHFAHWLVDLGFDMVVGMHPHVLQGYEVYRDNYIFYSIGNFVFDMPWEPTKYGAIVSVDFADTTVVPQVEYVRIDDEYAPHVVEKKKVPEEYRFDYLNKQLLIEDNSEEYHAEIMRCYKVYRKANHKDILKKMLAHPAIIKDTLKDYIRRRL